MIQILAPTTITQPARLKTKTVPRKQLSIGLTLYPTGGPLNRLWWRVLIEKSLSRYVLALSPFPAILLAKPEWALGLSQAPLLMFGVVLYVESYVLTITDPDKRRRIVAPREAARVLDLLQVRGIAALTRIAAARGLTQGRLYLVVEQSGLLRVPPLTALSLQAEIPETGYLDLDDTEQALLRAELFTDGLTEHDLRRANTAEHSYLRVITLDAATISAHARLAAMASG
ncbi:MAG: hypothetical protein AB8B85_18400 [Paracoccaceae bacterium]